MLLEKALDSPLFTPIKQAVKEYGKPAFVIGGYVRDHLLGRTCKDIDIVVEGAGIDLAKSFARQIGAKEVLTFANFGTAMVPFQDFQIEFVGARKESYTRNSRKPIIEEGTLEDDQLRRDFTINALSVSLNERDWGTLNDPFNGLEDLQKGIIRTPTNPEITFSDDPLRMMRAIRFATQLGFFIEPQTYAAIETMKDRIKIVSPERIIDELNKIVLAKQPSKGFKHLFNIGILELIFPEMVKLHGVDYIDGRGHKDNFYHTLKVLDNVSQTSDNLWLRWAAILHDIAKPATKRYHKKAGWTFHGHEEKGARMVKGIFQRLRLPLGQKMKFVRKLVRLHLRPIALVDEVVTDSAIRRLIVDAGEDLPELMKLCRADITTRDPRRMKRYLSNFDHVEQRIQEVEERDKLRNWQPPLDGQAIMELFNLPPSRLVGEIKLAVREAILEGKIPNELEAAIHYAKSVWEKLPPEKKK